MEKNKKKKENVFIDKWRKMINNIAYSIYDDMFIFVWKNMYQKINQLNG